MAERLVYLYSDPRDLTPRYVGIGTKKRMLSHLNHSHNRRLNNLIKKVSGIRPEVIQNDLNKKQAEAIERFWIAVFGRADKGTGTLFNGTDGGEGGNGSIRTPEQKEAQSKKLRGRPAPWVTKALTGKPRPDNAQRLAEANRRRKGEIRSDEFRATMSKAMKGVLKGHKFPTVVCPHCGKAGASTIMKRWHFDRCKELNYV